MSEYFVHSLREVLNVNRIRIRGNDFPEDSSEARIAAVSRSSICAIEKYCIIYSYGPHSGN
jgi:hypothetical protein